MPHATHVHTHNAAPAPAPRAAGRVGDLVAGAALGALLGLVIGLTTSPVAAIVVTGIVGLLGALFGLSDKIGPTLTATAARRLGAFALAAIVVAPVSIWVRVHEVLGVSVAEQRRTMEEIGIRDPGEQTALLRALRFGVATAAASGASGGATPVTAAPAGAPILYAAPSGFCQELAGLRALQAAPEQVDRLFAASGPKLARLGTAFAALPPTQRRVAQAAFGDWLCLP